MEDKWDEPTVVIDMEALPSAKRAKRATHVDQRAGYVPPNDSEEEREDERRHRSS